MYFPLYLSIYFYLFISLGATINLPALKKMEEIEEEEVVDEKESLISMVLLLLVLGEGKGGWLIIGDDVIGRFGMVFMSL